MSDREAVDFLPTVPLLAGGEEAELLHLARLMRRRTVQAGELLWRQGDEAQEILFLVDGAVSASLDVPGDRAVQIGSAGPGDVVGEFGLLDREGHGMSARVTETATVLSLGRLDFAALLAGRHPSAFRLKRRLASVLTARLRSQLHHLAVSAGVDVAPPPSADGAAAVGGPRGVPSARQPVRAPHGDLPRLRSAGALGLPDLRPLRQVPAGSDAARRRGSVAGVLPDRQRRGRAGAPARRLALRVGLVGPGRAFGYEGLIDGRPSPVTAITRERALLLVVPRELFARLFRG